MKTLLFIILLLVVQLQLLSNEKAVIVDINEFANFKELPNSLGKSATSKIKSQFGSRYSISYLQSKLDGTKLFPKYSNIKNVLSAKCSERFIYIRSHISQNNRETFIAWAEFQEWQYFNFPQRH